MGWESAEKTASPPQGVAASQQEGSDVTETLPRARGGEPGEFDWILMDPTQPRARGG